MFLTELPGANTLERQRGRQGRRQAAPEVDRHEDAISSIEAASHNVVALCILEGYQSLVCVTSRSLFQLWSLGHHSFPYSLLAEWDFGRHREPASACFSSVSRNLYIGDEAGYVSVYDLHGLLRTCGLLQSAVGHLFSQTGTPSPREPGLPPSSTPAPRQRP